MSGRYVKREQVVHVDGIPVREVVREWREDEEPTCERCQDYGEWVGEDSEVEPCPDCGATG